VSDGKKKLLEYPFSKTMLYINSFIGIFTIVFSVPLLYSVSENPFFSVALYLVLTLIVLFLSFKLKIYAIKKMTSGIEVTVNQRPRRGLIDRNFILLFILTSVALFSPVLLWLFFDSFVALLYLTVYVAGFSVSEPIIYVYCKK
jgi:membrane-bound metal-dependent hydrolase YbcI (DUF457 family)